METVRQKQMHNLTFTLSNDHIHSLLQKLHEMSDLADVIALADWDQQTAMATGASEVRGHQMATLQGLLHERWTEDSLGTLLTTLAQEVEQQTFTDADRGLVQRVQRSYERANKLPRALVEEIERVRVSSTDAWVKARTHNDFASFAPWLQRTIALQREVADRVGYTGVRYDALLDEYEPGITTAELTSLFTPIRDTSTSLLQRITAHGQSIDASCLQGYFPADAQKYVCEQLLQHIGYDFTHGGLASSAHPFTTSFGAPFDVRLTVRYNEQFLQMAVMAALHEGGHGLYEQGINPSLVRTPLASGASMGIHESQSRLWENAVGRSHPFWQGQYSLLQKTFAQQLGNTDLDTFVRALNRVEPSLIRIEADEVSYNLHILIRFELEQALVNGEVAVETLPRLWNAKYREYLGIEPDTDSEGILQDIHWCSGFGYFPSYTLGNMYAAQIFHTIREQIPDLDEHLASGNTTNLLNWLQEHLYTLGATYQPRVLLERVTGHKADPGYLLSYLTDKFSALYQLPA
jgi:carboxypeptidase Taq